MKKQLAIVVALVVVLCLLAGMAQAQETPAAKPASMTASLNKSLGLYVFPAKDQKPEQQAKDEQACYSWAVEQSGIDPLTMQATKPDTVAKGPDGSAVKGAAKGALAGAAIGAIAGDAGKGAAIGAAAGGMGGLKKKKQKEAESRTSPADSGRNRCCEDRQFQEGIFCLSRRKRLYRQVGRERKWCMPAMRTYILKTVALVCSIAWPVAAQETADSTGSTGGMDDIGQDTDPTKPVMFSLREEFTSLGENGFVNTVILRADRLVLEELGVPGPVRGVLTRLDLPIVTFSNSSTTETGLGDIYMQALVAPRIQGNFAMAAGTGLQMPTATSNLLGQGKWIASPTIVPIWFIPREGYAYIKVQDWFSFAGQSNRSAVHYLTVTGLIIRKDFQEVVGHA